MRCLTATGSEAIGATPSTDVTVEVTFEVFTVVADFESESAFAWVLPNFEDNSDPEIVIIGATLLVVLIAGTETTFVEVNSDDV